MHTYSRLISDATMGSGITGTSPFWTDPENAGTNFDNLITIIFGFLTIIAGLAFVLYFVLGAINWISSGGDQQKVEKARNQMTSAAIGLVAVIASYAIIGIVGAALGFDILNPVSLLESFPST